MFFLTIDCIFTNETIFKSIHLFRNKTLYHDRKSCCSHSATEIMREYYWRQSNNVNRTVIAKLMDLQGPTNNMTNFKLRCFKNIGLNCYIMVAE